jgi:hypothetical protein
MNTLQDLAQVSVPDVSITGLSLGKTKQCSKCKEYKALDLFPNNKSAKDGKHSYCKNCNAAKNRAYRKANPEKAAAQTRAYREANREKVAANARSYYKANREKIAVKQRKWDKANPEKIAAFNRVCRYNLTNEKYQELLDKQNNSCKICLKSFTDITPYIDHNHECCPGQKTCGKCIRGLLCHACNNLLGNAKDNRETLLRAADYVGAA